jgi:photosystem II stability/assembly factor-like uncharacterized protein
MAKIQPKTRPPGKGKQAAARRRAAQRRKRRQRWLALGLGILAAGLIVFLATRPDQPEGPASTAFTGGDFHSLVVDPAESTRIFAGGHQAVSVSSDGGDSWIQVDSLNDADAMGWAFLDGEILVGGHPGISVSTDGGRTFEKDNTALPSTDIHALGGGVDIFYAASPQAGFLVSADGRESWQVRNPREGRSFMGRVLVDAGDSDHIMAPDMAGGVVESRDGGRTWTELGGVQGAMWVTWDPSNPKQIIASGQDRAAISTDGGASWEPLDVPDGVQIIDMASDDPDLLYAGRHDAERVSVYVSHDGGKTWKQASRASR